MEISWGQRTPKEMITLLRSSYGGLSSEEAKKRLKQYGRNVIKISQHKPFLSQILGHATNPVSLILIVSGILLFFVDARVDAAIIGVTLLINIIISLVQEGKAENAFKKLNDTKEIKVFVRRDGQKHAINSEELVPGDIVILRTGNIVPADLSVLKETDLMVDESMLTGEWSPVAKHSNAIIGESQLGEKVNMLWKGTLIVGGTAEAIVIKTGKDTKLGDFSRYLSMAGVQTPLQKAVKRIAYFILFLVSVAVVTILILGYIVGIPFAELVFIGAAVSIAAIPNGLPATVTVVLAVGMNSILKRGGLVRNLLAAETLGATTWILTDKTGTLTRGDMELSSVVTSYGEKIQSTEESMALKKIIEASLLGTDSSNIGYGKKMSFGGGPIDRAIGRVAHAIGISRQILDNTQERITYLPFSSNRRFSASINKDGAGLKMYVVGSPEVLLDLSSDYVTEKGMIKRLVGNERKRIQEYINDETKLGKRVIAVAAKNTDILAFPKEKMSEDIMSSVEDLVFYGILVFEDPIREGVKDAIEFIQNANVNVTVVTGDNKNTALFIGKKAGIYQEDKVPVVEGVEFKDLEDDKILEFANQKAIFARMQPEQKLRLLSILQKDGEVVAMTGDGVNDSPTLQHASIGIAVGSGTEVAREASDLILLKNNFSTITKAIIEGRKIITNIRKIVVYLLSTSFSEVILIMGAILFGLPLPLLPAQILWANLVEEGFMSFGFAFEKEDPNAQYKDPHNIKHRRIIIPEIYRAVLLMSLATGAFLLTLYFFLISFTNADIDQIRTMMFIALSVDSVFFAVSLKRLDVSILKINIFDNKYLLWAIFGSLSLLVLTFFVPFLSNILSISLPPIDWLVYFVLISGVYHILVIELIKYLTLRGLSVKR